MSDSLNLEQLRKEAKALLKQCRAGDQAAIVRVQSFLPRLAAAEDRQILGQIKLADVQHALAREHGYRSWADLKRHDEPIVRFLAAVRSGALKEMQEEATRSPNLAEVSIHAACALGYANAVRQHLGAVPGLIDSQQSGWTPLLYAAASPLHGLSLRHAFGIRECAEILLDRGADPNTHTFTDPRDPDTRIPAITRAAMTNNRLVLQLLAQRGADPGPEVRPRLKDASAKTGGASDPLNTALTDLRNDPGFREELSRRLAPFRQVQQQQVQRRFPNAPPRGDRGFVSFIANMSIKDFMEIEHDDQGSTHDPNLVFWQLALERGFDPNLTGGPQRETLLHRFAMVARGVNVALTELLLKHGADANLATTDGRTPYSIAVRTGNTPVADVLVAYGANVSGVTPADEIIGACRRVDREKARSILRAFPDVLKTIDAETHELLADAAKNNNVPAVRLMLELGFDPGALAERGATPLHLASWHGYSTMVRLLLEFHAPVDVLDSVYRESPLAWAVHGSKHNPYANQDHYCAIVSDLIDGRRYRLNPDKSGSDY
jgi:ankyrin repeat protein